MRTVDDLATQFSEEIYDLVMGRTKFEDPVVEEIKKRLLKFHAVASEEDS